MSLTPEAIANDYTNRMMRESMAIWTVEDAARFGRDGAILVNGRLARGEATGDYGADVMLNAVKRRAKFLREHASDELYRAFVDAFILWEPRGSTL